MLLEMFTPASAPEPRAIRTPRAIAPKVVVEHVAAPHVAAPHVAPRERRPSMALSPEQFT